MTLSGNTLANANASKVVTHIAKAAIIDSPNVVVATPPINGSVNPAPNKIVPRPSKVPRTATRSTVMFLTVPTIVFAAFSKAAIVFHLLSGSNPNHKIHMKYIKLTYKINKNYFQSEPINSINNIFISSIQK